MRPALLIVPLVCLAVFCLIRTERPTQPAQVALTFDDLPIHGDLPPGESRRQVIDNILATLQREHLPPTYGFVNGSAVERDPSLLDALKAWRTAGNPLGNHTWSHPALSALTPDQFEADIVRNEPLLESLMSSEDWHYLRYPYLDEGSLPSNRDSLRTWLQQRDYKVAQVTQDFGDYRWNPPYIRCAAQHNEPAIATLEGTYLDAAERQLTQTQTISRLRYGREIPFIVLLHVGAFDAHMLPRLIALYRRYGITFVTLQRAQSDPAYRGNPPTVLRHGASVLNRLVTLRNRIAHPMRRGTADLDRICPNTPKENSSQ